GVGKTTVAANLGGFIADAGLRVLLIDLDIQPTLSSYFELSHYGICGAYELLAHNEQDLQKLISKTQIERLDLIFSNDEEGHLSTLLLHAPDGRFRLKNLLSIFENHYDLLLIDTQGARSVMLEMAIVASHRIISPVTPEILAAREFKRGTLQLLNDMKPYERLGIALPPIELLINRFPSVSSNAKLIWQTLHDVFEHESGVRMLQTMIPAIEVYSKASTRRQPVHRIEYSKPQGRQAPSARETIQALACELYPQWQPHFVKRSALKGKIHG
ncbi:MAG: ParA family protein, partial [Saezia sp.]